MRQSREKPRLGGTILIRLVLLAAAALVIIMLVMTGKLQQHSRSVEDSQAMYGNAEGFDVSLGKPDDNALDYNAVDVKPLFEGKYAGTFAPWLAAQLAAAGVKVDGVSEESYLSFTITSTGAIRNIEMADTENAVLAKEIIEIVTSSAPKWTPGEHRGDKVNVRYKILLSTLLN